MNGYRLHLALQPIVDMLTGRVKHYEALLRVQDHSVYGSSHVALLKAAEDGCWIDHLDIGVVGQAINVLRNCDIELAVNLSPRTLEVAAENLLKTLERAQDVTDRLILEITESAPIRYLPSVISFVNKARKLGCSIAVDDFGSATGFFTDNIVKQIRPDFLKLDGYVFNGDPNRSDTLARAVCLATDAGAEIIAEFIDTIEKEKLISALDIRYGQGHLYGFAQPWDLIPDIKRREPKARAISAKLQQQIRNYR